MAQARSLFEEGLALADRGDHRAAAEQLRRSYTLRPSPVAAYNLALQDLEIGVLVEARDMLLAAIHARQVRADLRRSAERLLASVEPRLAYLTLDVRGAPSDAVVTIDTVTVTRAQLGTEVARDPGRYVARVRTGRTLLAEAEFELSEGEHETVRLRVVAAARALESVDDWSEPAPVRAEERAPSDVDLGLDDQAPSDRPRSGDDTGLLIGVGFGTAAVVAVVVATIVFVATQTGPGAPPNSPFDHPVVSF